MTYEDVRMRAQVLAEMHRKVVGDFHLAILRMARHKKQHGTYPDDTKETFIEIKTRIAAITQAMHELNRSAKLQAKWGPIPDFMPEEF